jgi:glycine cleavage system H protein
VGERTANVVRIGITDYAQDALGDVVFVDLPKVGTASRRWRDR